LIFLSTNAGSFAFAPLEAIDEAQIHSQFGVNLIGPILATRAAVKHFPKEGGSVINVSSVASTCPLPGLSVYSATKSGLNALARVWAAELGSKGVTVNAVSPGPVDTEMFRAAGYDENAKNFLISRTPLGRIGTPSDIADVVAFLASPDARWVTGQGIDTTGGFAP
jgi:3-oxoacyl-[acyl-carrier protein] reductase